MLFKKMVRTLFKYKAQFISMVIMIALGIGVFVGFNGEWMSLKTNGDNFFNNTNYADYWVYSEEGFSEDDVAAVKDADGIDAAVRRLEIDATVKDSKDTMTVNVYDGYEVNTFYVSDGVDYDADAYGVWLSDKYADENGYKVGDEITVTYNNMEIGGEILGLIKCAEYLYCVADESQLMPDYTTHGYMFVTPEVMKDVIGAEFYSQILIKSDGDKEYVEDTVFGCIGKTLMILSRDEDASYVMLNSEIEEGEVMGSILPFIFLLIAVLTMVTTMHRVTSNEKTQIGTLKALGFKDGRIVRHYAVYGLFIGIIGTALGVALGFWIARVIVNPVTMEGTCFDMPDWSIYMPGFVWIVLVIVLAILTFISYLSVRKMLQGSAAETLQPYVPKAVKASVFERGKMWNRFSFSTKWNLRDIFRHKSRSAMTLFGVFGCVVILVAALGMSDTMGEYSEMLYNGIYSYEYMVSVSEDADNADVKAFAEEYDADTVCSREVKLGESPVSMDIYNITHDYIKILGNNDEFVDLSDDGVYVCNIIADENDIKAGDTITLSEYGSSESYDVKVVAIVRSIMTESIVMTESYAQSVGIPCDITTVYTLKDVQGGSNIVSSIQTRSAVVDSFDTFMEIMDMMVIILLAAGVLLSGIVLYNLGVMSYMERYRELATLKVIGFKDKHIGRLLIGQSIWLTVTGIILGLPAGYLVLFYIMKELGSEYDLKLIIHLQSYAVCILLTLGVSLIVGLMLSGRNKKIDMVASLKGAE